MSAGDVTALSERILAGDARALARAATILENRSAEAQALLQTLFPRTGRSVTVGITGAPGVGKSTVVDQLTRVLRGKSKTVGIVAVDPSSPYSRGALLGDRIRMERHSGDPGVFIRSMASRGKLGGLARGALEIGLLFDAAGRDVVLLETVGVGQDEVDVARSADVTVVVVVPGLGDDVQASKAGIMEIADVFPINKSDQPGAERLEQELRVMQSLASDAVHAPAVPICRLVASEGKGIEELWGAIESVLNDRPRRNVRPDTWALRLREMLASSLADCITDEQLEMHAQRVAERVEDPYTAVAALRARLLGK